MAEFGTGTPLSTQAKRDKYVRKPLIELGAETPKPRQRKKSGITLDPEETITPTSDGKDVTDRRRQTRRSPRNAAKNATSPPSSDYYTSSPITGGNDHFTSPHMSMIDRKTPQSAQSHSSRKNISIESTKVKKTLVCEDEDEEESSDDDTNTPSKSLRSNTSRRENISSQKTPHQISKSNLSRRLKDKDPSSFCDSPFCTATSIVLSTVAIILISMIMVSHFDLHFLDELPEPQVSGKGEAFKRFSRDLDKIKTKFPQQNKKAWSKLSGSIRRNMYGKSDQPLCFLFVYNDTAEATSDCLVNAVGTALFFATNGGIDGGVGYIKSAELTKDLDEAKGELFSRIDSSLKQDNIVILEDISKLEANPVMALHGICDEGYLSDQAVKPVVFITIADRGLENLMQSENEFEHGANLIRNLWEKDLGTDKVHPLISRIASVVIKVLPENFNGCPHL